MLKSNIILFSIMMTNYRIAWIDTCKALGIFLVVWGHVLTNDVSAVYIYGFHMPLFFFLSGCVLDEDKYGLITFFKRKFNTLPYCATDVGELCKPLESADIGWKIPTASVEEVRKMLLYLVNHYGEVRAKKKNNSAWKSVQELYDWNKISRQTENLY